MGSLLFLASWTILLGPRTYFHHLASGPRLPFTAVYFGSIALTLIFAFQVRRHLAVLSSFLQGCLPWPPSLPSLLQLFSSSPHAPFALPPLPAHIRPPLLLAPSFLPSRNPSSPLHRTFKADPSAHSTSPSSPSSPPSSSSSRSSGTSSRTFPWAPPACASRRASARTASRRG